MITKLEIKKSNKIGYNLFIFYFEDGSSKSYELNKSERYSLYSVLKEKYKDTIA